MLKLLQVKVFLKNNFLAIFMLIEMKKIRGFKKYYCRQVYGKNMFIFFFKYWSLRLIILWSLLIQKIRSSPQRFRVTKSFLAIFMPTIEFSIAHINIMERAFGIIFLPLKDARPIEFTIGNRQRN